MSCCKSGSQAVVSGYIYHAPQEAAYNLRFPGHYYDVETGKRYNYFGDREKGTASAKEFRA